MTGIRMPGDAEADGAIAAMHEQSGVAGTEATGS